MVLIEAAKARKSELRLLALGARGAGSEIRKRARVTDGFAHLTHHTLRRFPEPNQRIGAGIVRFQSMTAVSHDGGDAIDPKRSEPRPKSRSAAVSYRS
jgi:hypothetical protein